MEKNEYIEFEFRDEDKFKDLVRVFRLISDIKKKEENQPDEFWLEEFPDYALEHYYFADTDLKPKFPPADATGGTWHFYTMIEHLVENLDVELLDCKGIGDGKGCLDFYAYAYPYGGITGMTMFLHSFGFNAIRIDEGAGKYNVTWINETDFELKELVT